jgi:hypothetical protein
VSPTDAEAIYHEAAGKVDRANRRLWQTVASILAVVVILLGIQDAYTTSQVNAIRQTQEVNTNRSDCQDKALNAVLVDAKLALMGDRNPADYATAPKC